MHRTRLRQETFGRTTSPSLSIFTFHAFLDAGTTVLVEKAPRGIKCANPCWGCHEFANLLYVTDWSVLCKLHLIFQSTKRIAEIMTITSLQRECTNQNSQHINQGAQPVVLHWAKRKWKWLLPGSKAVCIASSYGKDQFQCVDLKYGMGKMEKPTNRTVCTKFEDIFFVIIRMPIKQTNDHFPRCAAFEWAWQNTSRGLMMTFVT